MEKFKVLHEGVSFDIHEGRTVAVVGESQVPVNPLRHVASLVCCRLTSGQIQFDGQTLACWIIKQRDKIATAPSPDDLPNG